MPNYCMRARREGTRAFGLRRAYSVTTVPGAGISTVK